MNTDVQLNEAEPVSISSSRNVLGISPGIDDDTLTRELTEFTSALVSYKTVAANTEAQRACLHFIGEYLGSLPGVHFSNYVSNDIPSLVITNRDTQHPDIILSGHIDVVPGASEQFVPRVVGDRLYGRGSMDMKGGVATIVKLFHDLVASGEDLPSIGLMLTSDEEQGGEHGARYLVAQKGWRARCVLIPEGKHRFELVTREKGVCRIKMTAHGTAAHGAYPWLGKNALDMVLAAYAQVQTLFSEPRDGWHSSLCLVSITTPDSVQNQVPACAETLLDIRFTDDFAPDSAAVLAKVRACAPGVESEIFADAPVVTASDNDPYLLHLQRCASAHMGRDVPFGYNNGASDAAPFAARGIPVMTSGVVGNHHHGPDEYVELASLRDYYHIVRAFLRSFPRS